MLLTVALVPVVALVGLPLYLYLPGALTGDDPEARIYAYVRSVVWRDERGALDAWYVYPVAQTDQLHERRRGVTRELVAAGLRPGAMIVRRQWWYTCCEPRVASGQGGAGALRAWVRVKALSGDERLLVFDVYSRRPPPFASIGAHRDWVVRDVYRVGEDPLAHRWRSETP